MAAIDQEKRRAFAREYAITSNGTEAARRAGVPEDSAAQQAYKWLRNPDVLALVRDEIDCRLRDLGPVAVDTVRDILLDPDSPARVRLAAAQDVLDRLGWLPPTRMEMKFEPANVTPQMLSLEELHRIARGETVGVAD
ncbi:phage terminase small subunit [Azospirillaceae bacterium]